MPQLIPVGLTHSPYPFIIIISFAGTSLITLPTDIAEMVNAQIGAKKSWNGQYQVDCSKVPNLPEFSFYFGGKAYPLKSTDYILEVQGTCMSPFTGMDINLPGSLWIVGMSTCPTQPQTLLGSNFTSQVMFSFVNITPFTISPEVLLVSPCRPNEMTFCWRSSFYDITVVNVHALVVYSITINVPLK